MKIIKFLSGSIIIFLLVSTSKGEIIPKDPDEEHGGWMSFSKYKDKAVNVIDQKQQTTRSLSKPDKVSNSGANPPEDIINQVDQMIDMKLNTEDFSGEEINKLKEFVHNGIHLKGVENLSKSSDLIIKNTEILIEKYKNQNKICKIEQGLVDNQNLRMPINEACFNSFIGGLCPLYPFC